MSHGKQRAWWPAVRQVSLAALLATAILAICFLAPTERSMGHAQRIVYLHVAVAWLSLIAMLGMAGFGVGYLARRKLSFDHWSQACGEAGWLCCGLALVTGSIWARQAWGTWWVWDPRLTSTLILWVLYSGTLLVKAGLEAPDRRARVGAVLACMASVDLPFIILATRWFRGMHPASPQMTLNMRMALLASVVSFSLLFAMLVLLRRRQLELEESVAQLHLELLGDVGKEHTQEECTA